ncbi:MAG TPA: hypothetical protein VF699_09490 [Caulobacteraceae bacterium]|jgi:hypothetical protein
MSQLSAEYLTELARQLGFVSAFLGGVAAAFVATLLTLRSPRRIVGRTIVCAAATAVAFIISVLGSLAWVAILHPQSPSDPGGSAAREAQLLTAIPFTAGIALLMVTIGMSGWIRSRTTGLGTTAVAVLGAALALLATADWG